MVFSPLENSKLLKVVQTLLVVSKNSSHIREVVSQNFPHTTFVTQNPPRGTAHAVMMALPYIKKGITDVLISYGDMPLIQSSTLSQLIHKHRQKKSWLTFATMTLSSSFGYGRVLRHASGVIEAIVEEKDATPAQRKIREVNVGLYVVSLPFLKKALKKIKTTNVQKEFYLTDLIRQAALEEKIADYRLAHSTEGLGVNTQQELAKANQEMSQRKMRELMNDGVVCINPEQITCDAEVRVARGATIMGPCTLLGSTVMGSGCFVEPYTTVRDSVVGQKVTIKSGCYLDHAVVGDEAVIGPMAHLRPGTHLKTGVKVGNFVEIKKSSIGEKSKINHLTYIGDALVGKNVNVGAGTITCNYDGKNKFKTVIQDGAFIGSDSQLVAPVTVGKSAYIGSGSTITKNVPPHSLALSRAAQTIIKRWKRR